MSIEPPWTGIPQIPVFNTVVYYT